MKAFIQRFRAKIAPLFLVLVATLNPVNAFAGCSSCWWSGYMTACIECAAVFSTLEGMIQGVSNQVMQSNQEINQNINTTRMNILDELNAVKNAIVSAIEKQTAAEQQLQQADLNYKAAQSIKKATADAEDKFTGASSDITSPNVEANACATMDTATATTAAANGAQLTARALAANDLRKQLYTSNSSAVIKKVLDDHNTNFCSAEDAKRGRCGSGGNTPVPPEMQNANLNAGSLFAPAGGQTYNEKETVAAKTYIDNVMGPVPMETLPVTVERTDAGKRYLVEDRAMNSVRSMASYSLNQIFSSHTPEDPNGTSAESKISIVGLMQKYVQDRYGNAAYRASLSTLGTEGLLREIAQNMAFQNWLDYYTYLQGERTEGLLATTLAMNARERSERLLPTLRQEAMRAAK